MSDPILVRRDGPIATVVLNRPDKLDALTKGMWRRLGEILGELPAEDELRCLVLRGAGGRAFSPGNDISEFETERHDPASAKAYGEARGPRTGAIRAKVHPCIIDQQGVTDHTDREPHWQGFSASQPRPMSAILDLRRMNV